MVSAISGLGCGFGSGRGMSGVWDFGLLFQLLKEIMEGLGFRVRGTKGLFEVSSRVWRFLCPQTSILYPITLKPKHNCKL